MKLPILGAIVLMPLISYRDGYKYQLVASYTCSISIIGQQAESEFIALASDGTLIVRRGYAWDGPSGPTVDTPNFMRGSLVHDALYQLMREGLLSTEFRSAADLILRDICREDGMSAARAWWVYHGVRLGGGPAAALGSSRPVKTAP